jgi:hypothetical protein
VRWQYVRQVDTQLADDVKARRMLFISPPMKLSSMSWEATRRESTILLLPVGFPSPSSRPVVWRRSDWPRSLQQLAVPVPPLPAMP